MSNGAAREGPAAPDEDGPPEGQQRRSGSQLRTPVSGLPSQHLGREASAAATPRSPRTERSSGGTDRDGPRGTPGRARSARRRHHPHRPAVRDDVMHRDEELVVCRTANEASPYERSALQVEWCIPLGIDDAFPLDGGIRGAPQVELEQLEQACLRRRDALSRLAVLGMERRPEYFMPRHESIERASQCRPVHISLQRESERDVIRGARRLAGAEQSGDSDNRVAGLRGVVPVQGRHRADGLTPAIAAKNSLTGVPEDTWLAGQPFSRPRVVPMLGVVRSAAGCGIPVAPGSIRVAR